MELSPEEFVERLLSKEAAEQPSDNVKPEEVVMELPEWFDEKKFNQSRRFFKDNSYAIFVSLFIGIIDAFAVPSVVRVLITTKHSNSPYTAYRRYASTLLHFLAWFDYELKPGTLSWKSLYAVRRAHVRASKTTQSKGAGVVSQKDMALTIHSAYCFALLKPDAFGLAQMRENDWEAYIYYWRVIAHMLGLEDRYNVCRETLEKTRQVAQLILDRSVTPNMTYIPEYFEHTARVLIDGFWTFNPTLDCDAMLFICRRLSNVPGYIYTENERIELQKKLKEQLNGKSLDNGVDTSMLLPKAAFNDYVAQTPRMLYYNDFSTINMSPEYRKLSLIAKYKLVFLQITLILNSFTLGRLFFNLYFKICLIIFKYFPLLAFFRYGIKNAYVNQFVLGPTDNTVPKLNSEYY